MGQIVFNGQKPKYCNLTAITTGSKKDYVIPNGEVWLIDSTNTSKTDGTGKYDYYIKGDGSKTASQLAENKIKIDDNSADVYTKSEVDDLVEDVVYFGDTVGNVETADFNAQTDTVWNKAQVLSAAQQAQARANIGAGTVSSVTVNETTYTPTNRDVNLGTIGGGGGSGEANVIESISINGTAQTVNSKNVDLPVPTSTTITTIVTLTEAQYTALATKNASTLYVIIES